MGTQEIWARLHELSVRLSVNNGELVVRGRRQILQDPAVVALIRQHKDDLKALILSGQVAKPESPTFTVPENLIPADATHLSPQMLTLVQLTQAQIDAVVAQVDGGLANIQDIYPLAPLQEGVLFHHMASSEGDPYLQNLMLSISQRPQLDQVLAALQMVINRHDILRTAVVWEGVPEPVQVVLRKARLVVEDVQLSDADGAIETQLEALFDPRHYRLDVRQAPLMRVCIAHDSTNDRWLLQLLFHHLLGDGASMRLIMQEIDQFLRGDGANLPKPLPFRDFVAQARLRVSAQQHESYFRQMLADVDEPTLPFGLVDVRGSYEINQVVQPVDDGLGQRLRKCARTLGVSVASLFHLAWAQVVACTSGREDVVFGTVLFGRMQGGEGANRTLGMFINTLPIRVQLGSKGVAECARDTHTALLTLLEHEHASLSLAQRCSGVEAPLPLFSALLNYRHSAGRPDSQDSASDSEVSLLRQQERTNFPLALVVEDMTVGFEIMIQADVQIDAHRVVAYVQTALENLAQALEQEPGLTMRAVQVLPAAEQQQLLIDWNDTAAEYPQDVLMHELFEAQVVRTPGALAVVFRDQQLTYAQLNARANKVARFLIEAGIKVEDRVAICAARSVEMVVGMLGILKAGAAYVPLDTEWPLERSREILARLSIETLVTTPACLNDMIALGWSTTSIKTLCCVGAEQVYDPESEISRQDVEATWNHVACRHDAVSAGGFISSYTGQPFAQAQVDEYRDHVIGLLDARLTPGTRVLEIGYGSGLLSFEMLRRGVSYVGLDPSQQYQHKNQLEAQRMGVSHASFETGYAHEVARFDQMFDVIVIASTTQFFPGYQYLETVLDACRALLDDNGILLLADVMDPALKGAYAASVQAYQHQHPGAVSKTNLDAELYVAQRFFGHYCARLGSAHAVEFVARSDSRFSSELVYRYDVLISHAAIKQTPQACEPVGDADTCGLEVFWPLSMPHVAVDNPMVKSDAGSTAYIIFTSGSTGVPKGVVLQHRPVVNLISWVNEFLQVSAGDRLFFVTSICFDLSVYDIFGTLAAGACLDIAPSDLLKDPVRLADYFVARPITFWDSAPGAFGYLSPFLNAERPAPARTSMRAVFLSGDWIPLNMPGRIRELFPSARIVALGGATEAAIWSNYFVIDAVLSHWSSIPYGKPIQNALYYVLTPDLQLPPVGVKGDLYIAGQCLALGYANQPQLTAERFIQNPFGRPGDKMYKTGDLARYMPDGNLEFLGRSDHQVKIRGFRVELGEIEAQLMVYPVIREAVVLAQDGGSQGKRLVAYYTLRDDARDAEPAMISAETLRAHLLARLPEYMVPSYYIGLQALPVTSNGKLNRQALPVPDDRLNMRGEYQPPVTAMEKNLAGIWAQVLRLDQVGREDNFFLLGGHSLLAVRVISQARETLGIEFGLNELFSYPVLDALAQLAEKKARVDVEGIVAVSRQELLPASFSQQRLWFMSQMTDVSLAYHISAALKITGGFNEPALRWALNAVVARHESLRTRFSMQNGQVVQHIAPANSGLALTEHDLRHSAQPDVEVEQLLDADASTPFDLAAGPLLRGSLIRVNEQASILLLTMHHIISDGWSVGILARELGALYEAVSLDPTITHDPLPPLAIQYADYAAWQRRSLSSQTLQAHGNYWRETLGGAPALLALPTDFPRALHRNHEGALAGFEIDAATTDALRALSERHGVTLYMTVLSAWALVLSKLSGQDDIVIGTPVANRNRSDVEPLIGFFVNTLTLRLDVTADPSIAELLALTKRVVLDAQAHQDLPFEQVVELLNPQRSLAYTPLFQVMLAWQSTSELDSARFGDLSIEVLDSASRTAKFDLTLEVRDGKDGLAGSLEYATALFAPETIARYLGYLRTVLELMARDDSARLSTLSILSPDEREQLLVEWNTAPAVVADPRCLHQLFEAQAARMPDAIAVVFEQHSLGYGALNRKANQLAHHLRALGVGTDDRVALCVERGLDMLVGILATLKAGAGYVPLDPVYPVERLSYMLQDSAPVVVLTQGHLRAALGALHVPVLELDTDVTAWQHRLETNPAVETSLSDLAYVIYTSGSTGQPKGVMVEHGNVTRLFSTTAQSFNFGPSDVWTLFHSFAFDFSVWEIWGALLHGGRLEILGSQMVRTPQAFYELLCERGVTVLNQTPSAFRQMIAAQSASQHSLRWVIFGGEALEPGILAPWYEREANGQTQLVNMYGITETTVHVTFRALTPGDSANPSGRSPIGRKLSDLRVYLLDSRQQPVPLGAEGELYVCGAGVARGYLNRPQLTAERFLVDPFSADPQARMYKTGDLARYLPNGDLEYLGRNDDQVKIRGFRIELGEIEARLAAHPAVGEAAVLALKDSTSGPQLVGYYTVLAGQTVDVQTLREHLSAQLPDYMVPAAYVPLDTLPLTANGKLDRRALPAPGDDAFKRGEYVAPEGETEALLAGIWADVLKLARVGRHDNFFELGGHSLLAVTLMERMRQAGLNADVHVLFGQPTLSAVAQAVAFASARKPVEVPPNLIPADCSAITPAMLPLVQLTQAEIDTVVAQVTGGVANVQDIYPLAPLQEGVLFHHMASSEGDPYLQNMMLSIDSRSQLDRFLMALQAVIDRHDILRTGVLWEGLRAPVQVVLRQAQLPVEEVSLSVDDGDIESQLASRFDPRHYRLDVRQAPMMRVCIAEDALNNRWLLQVLFHHLVDDVTSMRLMIQEIDLHLRGETHLLAVPAPFRNFVAQALLGMSVDEHEAYFRERLSDIDEPTLPFGVADVQGDGRDMLEVRQVLDSALAARLRQRAQRLGVSAASLFHLAYAQVIGHVSGRDDVVFGTVLFGRMQGGESADRVMGMFINTLPIRVRLGQVSVREGVYQTHEALSSLLAHEHASLALAQLCSGVAAPAPLFSALLNYRQVHGMGPVEDEPVGSANGIQVLGGEERTNYPLTLSVDDRGEDFSLAVMALNTIGAQRVGAYMLVAMQSLADALENAPQAALRGLNTLPQAEREQLLVGFNATQRAYPQDKTVHGLFEAQVAKQPEAVAAIHNDQALTYRELNQRANRLAHHLIGLGLQPGERVAMLLGRSLDLLLSQLAILKCGAVYVPLDINAPVERQHFMVQDSQSVFVLTHSLEADLSGTRRVDLDTLVLTHDVADPQLSQSGETIAYIMYTSGSTGTPKGVLVPHRAINRLVINNGYADFNAQDRVAFASNPAFDASTLDVWAPLLNGGCVVVVEQDVLLSQDAFRSLLREQSVNVLWMTAGLFHQYADGLTDVFQQLRYLIVGGDVLDPAVIGRVLKNGAPEHLLNGYGPTEATTFTTTFEITSVTEGSIPIGRPIGNARVYVLDAHLQPVAVGVAGELYIGGDGVAKGYLNQPELTAEKFIADPFSSVPDARLYRTGDLARWLPQGTVEYLGRNDNQVKIRGFRIELGEIETRLGSHDSVREAAVLVVQDSAGSKQLVGYYTAQAGETVDSQRLRAHLAAQLPDYMVPAAYVQLHTLPLTANGKLDRLALPAPDDSAFSRGEYVAPIGETETLLAGIWADVLKLDRVGRHDNFFELGGHSLLAVSLMERMRQAGLHGDVRVLFGQPTLSALAAAAGAEQSRIEVPPNLIPADCTAITPAMLPLVQLTQAQIDAVVAQVDGGAGNVQDIYPLAPLQEGVLFHHMASHAGDPYLLNAMLSVASRSQLDSFLAALQVVVDRHDILRTAVLWEGLSAPVQVVVRQARLVIEEIQWLAGEGDAESQLAARFDPRHYRLDVRQAPMLRACIAEDTANNGWLLQLLYHHAVMDHTGLEVIQQEIDLLLRGEAHALPAPLPFRNFVAQTRLGMSVEEHEAYFREQLADVDEPTLPFGLVNVQGDGNQVLEVRHGLNAELSMNLRKGAQRLSVSAASLFHLAWAQVLGRVCGRDDVVFGTVLFGRLQGGDGADRVLGMFINTLPIRVRLGNGSVEHAIHQTHDVLSSLLIHEHASLTLAQRCSGVRAPLPLFSALLNYRHSSGGAKAGMEGIALLSGGDRTNYPLVLSVDDFGQEFELVVQADAQLDARRIAGYVEQALSSLVTALQHSPSAALSTLDVLPAAEREQLLLEWNEAPAVVEDQGCLHQLFEAQVSRAPQAIAVAFEQHSLTYGELNRKANRLAHHLRGLGVGTDDRVALCVERGVDMLVGILAILKAGAGYVPLDPVYPVERLTYLLQDSAPSVVVTQRALLPVLGALSVPVVALDDAQWQQHPETNLELKVNPSDLAYVIYTSGSTGQPKGVMVEHGNVVRLFCATAPSFNFGPDDVWTLFHSFAFDFSVWEIWGALLHGGRLEVLGAQLVRTPQAFYEVLCERGVTMLNQTPSAFRQLIAAQSASPHRLRWVVFGGEALEPGTLLPWYEREANLKTQLVNMYGITETTVHVTFRALTVDDAKTGKGRSPIGRKLADLRVYVLDADRQPVPLGAEGELYVGGAGVARGYLNRPELTAERFLNDPFSPEPQARMYKTGDLARYLSNGDLEYLGRNDDQVKIRGFRIELGEIEARLAAHECVAEAAVLALKDSSGGKQLVGYYTVHAGQAVDVQALRAHLSAQLPDYMVPAAYVQLDALPLTANGKLDRRALPAPGDDAFKRGEYVAPVGETETLLAGIWADVLKLERVGRHDNFFELGGHSLLAVSLMERMRQAGLNADVQVLFGQPTLSALAQSLGSSSARSKVEVPPNLIPAGCTAITPAMLPLAQLTQPEIDTIVAHVEGGVSNVQDIYPLAPLQEGVLFHHMASSEGDPYLQNVMLSIDSRVQLDNFLTALQAVIDRHEILRTGVLWEGLREPVQVVLRHAALIVEEVSLSAAEGDIDTQLATRFDPRHYRLDVRQAPMMRACIAEDAVNNRWLLQLLFHHLVDDVTSMRLLIQEIETHLRGEGQLLSAPIPFRNFVAQARLGISVEEHERYFRQQLGDVDEPTLPFGLVDVQGNGSDMIEARLPLQGVLAGRLRMKAQQLGVSVASLFHLAWAQVLGRVSGREDVVFGTVLFGRLQGGAGADRVLGMFINTLPIRVRLGAVGVRDAVQQTHEALSTLLVHEHASLALAQRCSGVAAPLPLFSALLNYRHVRELDAQGAEGDDDRAANGIVVLDGEERSNYPLALSVDDYGADFELVLQVSAQLDAQRIVAYMGKALESLAQALEQAPAHPLRTLDILPDAERRQLLVDWNKTTAPYPKERCLHELFEAQVLRSPDAIAVLRGEESVKYAELNQRANRLAHYLRSLGVRPDDRVALCVERSIDMVVGMLGVLKAGAAYVPIDPGYPAERLAYMLEDCAPRAVLTQSVVRKFLNGLPSSVPVLELDTHAPFWQQASSDNPHLAAVGLTSSNLAYVIYTSGSTGQPKGVMLEHHTIQNLLAWYIEDLQLSSEHAVLLVTSQSFDLTQKNILGPLAVGARLYLAAEAFDPATIAGNVRDFQITHLNLSSSAFYALLDENQDNALASLRQVVVGGEPVKVNKLKLLHEPRPTLINGYGPTECSDITSCYPITGNLDSYELSGIPIGRPIRNLKAYLLDEHDQPVPLGTVGELCIGGVGVARGYLNRDELTAQRFLPDPFSDDADARMYRTGDQARYLPDGKLEYLGRNDDQVKIRGFRIELGEIEGQLGTHADLDEVAVLAREDVAGDKRLVAYYTVHEGATVDLHALRAYLSARVPEYMVPAAFVALHSMPLTANGKLDRRALPAPDDNALGRGEYEAPVGDVETQLALIWADVLKLERVGRHDNFFELGGHSLLAMRVVSRVRQSLGAELKLQALFAHPQLAAMAQTLAQTIDQAPMHTAAIKPVARGAVLPLSYAQQRLWFLAQIEEIGTAYHINVGLRLQGALNRSALCAALDSIVARHESLRTVFELHEGVPMQRIKTASGFALHSDDVRASVDQATALAALLDLEAATPFDLANGPLIRGRLIRLGEQEHVLLVTVHHIVSDGWSMGVLTHELSALYGAFSAGLANPLPPLELHYADYSVWQRDLLQGPQLQAQQAYWQRTLAGAPALLALPTDRPRPVEQDYAGTRISFVWDEHLTQGLKALAQRHGATLFMTVLSGWSVLLSKLSGQDDVVIGTPMENRSRIELESLIGLFVNTLALRLDLSGTPTVAQLLTQVRQQMLEGQAHQELPFEQVVEVLKPPRSLAHTPLFQVMLAWQSGESVGLELGDLHLEPLPVVNDMAKFDLTLELGEMDGCLSGSLEYATALFDATTASRHLDYLQRLLAAMVADEHSRVASLPILSDSERQHLLVQCNDTAEPYAHEQLIHGLFEAQVLRTPAATAVVNGHEQISYEVLNQRANRLAHHLGSLGVKPDDRVALCLERNIDMVVGMLAILKAGAAYVPLDPSYPAERLGYMLQDSAPVVALVHSTLRSRLGLMTIPVLELDTGAGQWQSASEQNPQAVLQDLTSRHLAYVIYTSGSTGQPKGVMVEHRGVVNLLTSIQARVGVSARDQVLALTTVSFDIAALELYVSLGVGASIVMASREDAQDPARLAQLLIRHDVTVMQATPSTWRMLLDAGWAGKADLKALCGGEAFPLTYAARLLDRTATLWNLYGPTETTIWSMANRIEQAGGDTSDIGRPLSNTRVYLLDRHAQPVPFGVIGELYIGGAGVARGYWNQPELTDARFLPDPFSPERHARMYRTGDLGRYLANGHVEYLGRNDQQVKLRGLRLELGEVEAQLMACPGVGAAAVVVREDIPGQPRLVGYYTQCEDSDASELDARVLREYLLGRLPDYMVPAAYVRLARFPQTLNGKLDRRALPAPDASALGRGEFEAPVGALETLLAGIWCDVLQLDQVGRHDNVFELGGHSLLLIQLLNRLKHKGLVLAMVDFFNHPTVQSLAERLGDLARKNETQGIVPLRTTGSQKPLFLIHEGLGVDYYFATLARHIDADIPVYGLSGAPLHETAPNTLEGVARRLVALIRSVQPHGPYRLAGWSYGGTVAYEIAAQLLGQNEAVECVCLLDSFVPAPVSASVRRGYSSVAGVEDFLVFCQQVDQMFARDDRPWISAAPEQTIERFRTMAVGDVVRTSHEQGLLPWYLAELPAAHAQALFERWFAHGHALNHYAFFPIPTPLYLFSAQRQLPQYGARVAAEGALHGWNTVVPAQQITRIVVPGDHYSIVANDASTLGQALTGVLQPAPVESAGSALRGGSLLTIQTGKAGHAPVVCVPGAGDSATNFIALASELKGWHVYGLQPQGLDGVLPPHTTVQAAAQTWLNMLEAERVTAPVHLVGHSFGGWVAFEMALRLQAQGRPVASLTLIDSEVPGSGGVLGADYTFDEVLLELVRLIELSTGQWMNVDKRELQGCDVTAKLVLLHRHMVRIGLFSTRSDPGLLTGTVRAFGAALRTRWLPGNVYQGAMRLVHADDSKLDRAANFQQYQASVAGWSAWAPGCIGWQGPGNHFSILKAPQVSSLAQWWLSALTQVTA